MSEYDVKKWGRVGVLMGGYSSEREISLKSGQAVFNALTSVGCEVVAVDICDSNPTAIKKFIAGYNLDLAFIVLHGKLGEDGEIQTILDDMKIPYTGSGPQAHKSALNKIHTQNLLRDNGVMVAPSIAITKKDRALINQIASKINYFPVVVKPACEGSSIGITLVNAVNELNSALETAWAYGDEVLIEKFVAGKEMTVGVINGRALPVVQICPKSTFFDFQAKYQSGTTEYLVPAPIEPHVALRMQSTAVKVFELLRCEDLARIDFIFGDDGQCYVLEVNTIPGFTSTSLLPKAARFDGMDFSQLCCYLLELAYGKKKRNYLSSSV